MSYLTIEPDDADDIDDHIRLNGAAAAQQKILKKIQSAPTNNSLSWLEKFEMTEAEAQQISDPEWAYDGLFVQGHVVAIVSPPNGGKTTICLELAGQMAADYNVVFVHADTGPAEAKQMLQNAKRRGFRYLTPDLKVGLSMKNVVLELQKLADSDMDLTGQVWFFDTLKKMADVINKGQLKALLQIMRKLSARGMTVVLIGHTNKYRDAEGNYKFEGTGDLEADVDELVYFEPDERPDGGITVSTRCTKKRAEIQNFTWSITQDRRVKRESEYIDVNAKILAETQRERDQDTIEIISAFLQAQAQIQSDIVVHCKTAGIGKRTTSAVLRRYRKKLWMAHPQKRNNAMLYELNRTPLHSGESETTGSEDDQF